MYIYGTYSSIVFSGETGSAFFHSLVDSRRIVQHTRGFAGCYESYCRFFVLYSTRYNIPVRNNNEARPRERSDRGRFLPLGKKASSYRGAYRVPIFNWSVYPSVSVCVTFDVFTDCESCTRPISTNPGSMDAGKYGLARGTCFFARRLELVAVAWMLWLS